MKTFPSHQYVINFIKKHALLLHTGAIFSDLKVLKLEKVVMSSITMKGPENKGIKKEKNNLQKPKTCSNYEVPFITTQLFVLSLVRELATAEQQHKHTKK